MSELDKYKKDKVKICGEEFEFSSYNAEKIKRLFIKITQIINDTGFGQIQFSIENKKITTIKKTETDL